MEFFDSYIVPVLFVVLGFLLGVIAEKIIVKKLRACLDPSCEQRANDHFRLRGVIIALFIIGGIFAAINYATIDDKLVVFFDKILVVVAVFTVCIMLSRFLVFYISSKSPQTNSRHPVTTIFTKVTSLTVYVIGFFVVMNALGVSIMPLLTALGVGGLAVALALQDTLSNFFAGIQIVSSRVVNPGDYVRIETGDEGYILDVGWRNTTIRSVSNNLILIPNSKLASNIVTNYTLPETALTLIIPTSISYNDDLDKVENVALDAARAVIAAYESAVKDFEPLVRFSRFGDNGIEFNTIFRVKEYSEQFKIRSAFIKELKLRFDAAGIEIPYPMRNIIVRKN